MWKVHGRGNTTLAVKMMKGEHDVDNRNMERHRQDAISMERLTSSPNIVSIYGHCGNTVLTEHLPRGLDTLLFHNGDVKQSDTVANRQTPLGRLRLALHVARGVAAIHDIAGGPIIHADIEAVSRRFPRCCQAKRLQSVSIHAKQHHDRKAVPSDDSFSSGRS